MQQLNKLIAENRALLNDNEMLKAENAQVKQRISQLDENAVLRVTAQKDAIIERLNAQLTAAHENYSFHPQQCLLDVQSAGKSGQ